MRNLLRSPSPKAEATVAGAGECLAESVWFPSARAVEVRQEAIGVPRPNEIRVRTLCSAISHGTELLVYRGQVPSDLQLDLPTLQGSFGFPIKYGYASVGVIDMVGDKVTDLRKGDMVFVHHPHQSFYTVPAESAIRIPPRIDPEAAALLANLETAINIVLDAHATPSDRALVFGQGVVGLLVTQVLRRNNVRSIIAVDPIERRRELAKAVGAERTLQPTERLKDQVFEATDGQGADLAIEVSGNPAALNDAIECLRFQGTIVAASWYGTKPVSLHLGGAFHRNRLRIISSQVSHMDPSLAPAWTPERRLTEAVSLLGGITWKPLITHRFPIARAAEAYRLLDERGAEAVQVLFNYV